MTQKRYYTEQSTTAQDKSPNTDAKPASTRLNRAKYSCKPELKQLIDWVNLVPPDHEMKPLEEIVGDKVGSFLRIDTPEYKEYELRKAEALIMYLKSFPKEIMKTGLDLVKLEKLHDLFQKADKLSKQMIDPENLSLRDEIESTLLKTFRAQESLYWSLRTTRKTLYRLAEIGENPGPYLGQKLKDVILGTNLLMEYAYLDERGILQRTPNRFAETLVGVEVSRIRACLICRKLFWANRKDKRCCSEEHSRIIRQRQVRANQKLNKDIYGRGMRKREAVVTKNYEDAHTYLKKDNLSNVEEE
jgi:hypothetical protein